MSKSNHPLMRLVRAKFEHACMISDTVENVGVFVDKYLYEYKVCGYDFTRCAGWKKICAVAYRNRTCAVRDCVIGIWHGEMLSCGWVHVAQDLESWYGCSI